METARALAVKLLCEIELNKAYSNIALNKILSGNDTSLPDKALLTALFYGVLDRKITIDFIISNYVKTPIKKIKPITLNAIRIAIYQIAFMDKIPDSAAVNESVNIVKKSKERYNASFTNGVLRSYLRNPAKLPQDNSVNSLSVRYSCPIYIIESFISDYGLDQTISLLNESLKVPPVYLRVNTLKTDALSLLNALSEENIEACISEILDNCIEISNGFDIKNSISYKNGLFHIQDMASQLAVEKLGVKAGERVADLCAAPGGKTFTMAELMQNKGEISAFDIYLKRCELIKSQAKRLSIDIIKTKVCDATAYTPDLGLFDAILCDVPCSGLGVIRRKPEIKYKEISNFEELEKTQEEILNNAYNYLKEGGRILYSTCTLRKAENELQTHKFLDSHSDCMLKYEHTFMPNIDGTDGFYCALIFKEGEKHRQ